MGLRVWDEEGVAEAAVFLDEAEADRLARFLDQPRPPCRPGVEDVGAPMRTPVEFGTMWRRAM